jgi:hypothetical protein
MMKIFVLFIVMALMPSVSNAGATGAGATGATGATGAVGATGATGGGWRAADTKANIMSYDPAAAGEITPCTDCSITGAAISTGTEISQVADIADRRDSVQ